jgi:ssDNA-binding replication factor A large subunit
VQPIEALNPYQSAWTIRVRAAGKGALRTVKTARGEMSVFSVELTDEQVRHALASVSTVCLLLVFQGHHDSGHRLARGS